MPLTLASRWNRSSKEIIANYVVILNTINVGIMSNYVEFISHQVEIISHYVKINSHYDEILQLCTFDVSMPLAV